MCRGVNSMCLYRAMLLKQCPTNLINAMCNEVVLARCGCWYSDDAMHCLVLTLTFLYSSSCGENSWRANDAVC